MLVCVRSMQILEYADFTRSAAGGALPLDTVRRVRGLLAWLEGLLPDLLPAVDALLVKHSKQPLRVAACAVDVIMQVHCRFPQTAAARQGQQVVLVTDWLTSLYASAHARTSDLETPLRAPQVLDASHPAASPPK